jgi:membrane-bound ClpP family serine protease
MNGDSSRAFLGLILGMLSVYAELVFPGLVLPGMSGLVVVMLSISYFTAQAICSHGVVLLGLTALLLYLDGWLVLLCYKLLRCWDLVRASVYHFNDP